ncbi:MAG: hypothetical protein RSB78_03310 [Oscillospiraceae bacterium]
MPSVMKTVNMPWIAQLCLYNQTDFPDFPKKVGISSPFVDDALCVCYDKL